MFAMHVMHDDAGPFRRHAQPVAARQRSLRIVVTLTPMLAHRSSRKFMIFRRPFVGLLLIDQMHDGDIRQLTELVAQLAVVISQFVVGDFRQRVICSRLPFAQKAIDVGVVSRSRSLRAILAATAACPFPEFNGAKPAPSDMGVPTGNVKPDYRFPRRLEQVVTVGDDGAARIWRVNIESGSANVKEIAVVRGHDAPITHAEAAPDGNTLITADMNGTVRVSASVRAITIVNIVDIESRFRSNVLPTVTQ